MKFTRASLPGASVTWHTVRRLLGLSDYRKVA